MARHKELAPDWAEALAGLAGMMAPLAGLAGLMAPLAGLVNLVLACSPRGAPTGAAEVMHKAGEPGRDDRP